MNPYHPSPDPDEKITSKADAVKAFVAYCILYISLAFWSVLIVGGGILAIVMIVIDGDHIPLMVGAGIIVNMFLIGLAFKWLE